MTKPPLTVVERRRSQRFDVALKGEYLTDKGDRNKITIVNISSSGLQFIVEQVDMLTLVPNAGSSNSMSPVSIRLSVDLNFELTDGTNRNLPKNAIEINCGIVYVKRHSMTSCIVGCRFEEFIDDSADRLSLYLTTHR